MNEQTNSQKDLRAGRWSCLSITQPGCDVTIHLKSFEIDFATGSFFLPNEKNRKKTTILHNFLLDIVIVIAEKRQMNARTVAWWLNDLIL